MNYTDQDYEYVRDGTRMSRGEAEKLVATLAIEPSNWKVRARLLSYYATHPKDKNAGKDRLVHVLWLIRNKPDLPIGFGAWSYLSRDDDASTVAMLRQEWVTALQSDPNNLDIIHNAVTGLQSIDAQLCEQLLLRAKELEPDNPIWSGRLAQIYQMRQCDALLNAPCGEEIDSSAQTAGTIRELEAGIARAAGPSAKLKIMQNLLVTVIPLGDGVKAREVATALLELANANRSDRDYGQYVYQANFALAQIALAEGALDDAMNHLLKASETPGSQELKIMGPDFELARELWERGKRDEVIAYINNCKHLWEHDAGACDRWLKQIAQGQTPDFNKNELNARSFMKMLGLGAKLFFNNRKRRST